MNSRGEAADAEADRIGRAAPIMVLRDPVSLGLVAKL